MMLYNFKKSLYAKRLTVLLSSFSFKKKREDCSQTLYFRRPLVVVSSKVGGGSQGNGIKLLK